MTGGTLWPTEAQEHLLQAALGTVQGAAEHFERWIRATDLRGEIDEGSFRTLPLVYTKLTASGYEHPIMPRLKGVYRNSWVTVQRHTQAAVDLLVLLHERHIATMTFKGLALAYGFYAKPALRPMSDIDIMVPISKAAEASTILAAAGYAPMRPLQRSDFNVRHALAHVDREKGEIDLHWHALFECGSASADRHFWSGAQPIQFGGIETLRPCATDLLLHGLVHGLRYNISPPMRWIVDSCTILASGEPIDWPRLTDFAVRHRLSHRVGRALAYLAERFAPDIPETVLSELARAPSLTERAEMHAMEASATARNSDAYRHHRRFAHILRLFTSYDRRGLPSALVGEALRRRGAHG